MKKTFVTLIMLMVVAALAGCGDGGHGRQVTVTSILSDKTVDADIKNSSGTLTVTPVSSGSPSVLAGLDPFLPVEYRAFLHFPLGSVPLHADIDSATLDIFIRNVTTTATRVPIRIELVDFTPPVIANDFNRSSLPPVDFITVDIFPSDVGHHVRVDVTPLMMTAQAQGLPDFQVRILEDLGPVTPGVISIDETANATAPLLSVAFF